MGLSFNAAEDLNAGDGNRITEPGIYHVTITNIREGEGPNGKPCDGFTIEGDVLGGTVEGCHGKTFKETIFMPNLKGTEEAQAMALKKVTAFCIATGLMTPSQLGQAVDIDVNNAVGRQLVIEFDRQMAKNEQTGKWDVPTKYLTIAYANIYHVDDPEVKDVPKNADALGMRADGEKKDASYFAFRDKRGTAKSAKREPVAAAASSQFDAGLDDI